MASHDKERREERYPVRIPVTVRMGSRRLQLITGNVSFRGLFLCTDEPPVLRQLISVEVELPPNQTPFQSHAMSLYVLDPSRPKDLVPGVGLQFYAQSSAQRQIWEQFVSHIKDTTPPLSGDLVDPVHRHFPRVEARFEVHPQNIDELEVIFSHNISAGGMFLETPMCLEVGHPLSLEIIHPVTRKGFTIESMIRRRSTSPVGLGVVFMGMDGAKRSAFEAFIRDGLSALKELDNISVEFK